MEISNPLHPPKPIHTCRIRVKASRSSGSTHRLVSDRRLVSRSPILISSTQALDSLGARTTLHCPYVLVPPALPEVISIRNDGSPVPRRRVYHPRRLRRLLFIRNRLH